MYLLYIAELRVFRSKNSVVLLYTAIRGVNGLRPRTDAVLSNNDVCIKTVRPVHGFNTNSQLTSIQGTYAGQRLANDGNRMVARRLHFR